MGDVTISGDVAGRDLSKTSIAPVQHKQELLELLAQLRREVGDLDEASEGQREDAQDELRKAHSAAERDDGTRVVEKLESARHILEAIGTATPAAVSLAQTVGGLLQNLPRLS